MKSCLRIVGTMAAIALSARSALAQQARAVSLEEALRVAMTQSETVRIAQAGVLRARGQELQARSAAMPQLNGSATYTRTLATQFSALRSPSKPTPPSDVPPAPPTDTTTYYSPCLRYLAPGGASDAARLNGLELYTRCSAANSGGIDFSKVGFGAKNQYSLGAIGSLTLWSGGRIPAQYRAAAAGRRSANIELTAQRAQLALTVTEAYYDAVLADKLMAIADSSLHQTESVLRQTRLARQVGNQSEFDLLKAQVTRDNQTPVLLQRRTAREIAYLRVKQLLNIPYTESLQLTTDIDDKSALPPLRMVAQVSDMKEAVSDTSADMRATVRQLVESVKAQEAQVTVARAEWLPTISLSSAYSRVAFGAGGIPSWGNFLNNWTVSLGASFPIFTGGRIRGDQYLARANVDDARARLDQTRELAALDARQTIAQLETAEAVLRASEGTAEQAAKAYTISDVRYREGISTQVELSDSRLLLEQARANRAQAARDLQVARMRLVLLKDLPLGAGSGSPAGARGGAASGAGQQTQGSGGASAATTTGTEQ